MDGWMDGTCWLKLHCLQCTRIGFSWTLSVHFLTKLNLKVSIIEEGCKFFFSAFEPSSPKGERWAADELHPGIIGWCNWTIQTQNNEWQAGWQRLPFSTSLWYDLASDQNHNLPVSRWTLCHRISLCLLKGSKQIRGVSFVCMCVLFSCFFTLNILFDVTVG